MGKKIFTVSYDDSLKSDLKLIELMKEYGIRGTFNINTGVYDADGVPTWDDRLLFKDLGRVYDNDFCEVASHTLTHPDLTVLENGKKRAEIIKDIENIEKITGKRPKGFAYPFGTYDGECCKILAEQGIVYARTVNAAHNLCIPRNWLLLNPSCHHDDSELQTLADEFIGYEGDEDKLFYVWGHTFEFERNGNWQVIENLFKKVSAGNGIMFLTNYEAYCELSR